MQLIHGNCLEEMSNIPDKSIDMILADLPYGTTACLWDKIIPFELLWENYIRILKRTGIVTLFGKQPFTSLLITSNLKMFRYEILWIKEQGTGNLNANKSPLIQHENILIFSFDNAVYNPQMSYGVPYSIKRIGNKHELFFGGTKDYLTENKGVRYPTSLLCYQRELNNRVHPTQKPVALLEYLIRTYTNEGDTVLDNCMGSGSTGIACLNTKRDFIGIELYPLLDRPISKDNPDYFGIAEKRIARHKFEPINDDSKNGHVILF